MTVEQRSMIFLSIGIISLAIGSFIDTHRINGLKDRIDKLEQLHEKHPIESGGPHFVAR